MWRQSRRLLHFAWRDALLPPNQGISIYNLASVLLLLAATPRVTDRNDWMTTDSLIACPNPDCPSQLKIVRDGLRYNSGPT
ncbi:hypothetical protein DPV78_001798 [Talaromyces pinophilus]|nr:hypothetical protein DPV78_001798 [Talaromyces pinophilus]